MITLEMVREELGLFEVMGKDTYAYQLAPHLRYANDSRSLLAMY